MLDPRYGMAQQGLQTGASTAPVQSWGEGLARMLQAGIGGYQAGQLRQEYQDKDAARAKTMAEALAAMGPQQAQGPMESGAAGYQVPGDFNAGIQKMASNPELADLAATMQMNRMTTEQDAAQKAADRAAQQSFQREQMQAEQGFRKETLGEQQKFNRETLGLQQSQAEKMARLQADLAREKQVPGRDVPFPPEVMQQQLELTNAKQAAADRLSPAAQKEVFEADDTIQASQNAIGLLNEALNVNPNAYSGPFALDRAKARSIFGDDPNANATVQLNNIVTGQALESLKAIFGGMPTEGERKILLDMQASADKTPEQRADIIKRAMAAAEKRGAFASKKAEGLRGGTYFKPGQSPAPSGAPAGGGVPPPPPGFEVR
jgi:hypothetical protein